MSEQDTITLKEAIEAYLENLVASGAKSSTINVYKKSMELAITHFGQSASWMRYFYRRLVNFTKASW